MIIILTGAGISASSGIPTYANKKHPLWKKYDLEKICHVSKRGTTRLAEFFLDFGEYIKNAQPSVNHMWLADQSHKSNVRVYTQNVDDLIERAGGLVHHVHGMLNDETVVLYGEQGLYDDLFTDLINLEKGDLFIVIGTACNVVRADLMVMSSECTKVGVNPCSPPTRPSSDPPAEWFIWIQSRMEDAIEKLTDLVLHTLNK